MVDATHGSDEARPTLGDFADLALGFGWIVWCAEALVRFDAGPVLTAAFYGLLALRLAALPSVWLPAALGAWPLFLFPLMATVSAAWSPVPTLSAVAGVQVLATVLAGIYLGARFGLRGLAGLVAGALGLTMALSAVNLAGVHAPTHGVNGEFLGIYAHKNALGQRAALLVVALGLGASLARGTARGLWLAAIAGVGALLALSLSMTSILLGPLALGAFWLWGLAATRPGSRPALALFGGAGAAAAAAVVLLLPLDPLALVFDATGKDATLTGRTALWATAWAQAHAAPVQGLGFMAFWTAPGTAQEAQILAALYGEKVTAFHNFALEILVALGPPGLLAMGAGLLHTVVYLLRVPPGPLQRWALVSFGMLVMLSLFGSSLFRPHEITLLLIPAMAAAARAGHGSTPRRGVRSTAD